MPPPSSPPQRIQQSISPSLHNRIRELSGLAPNPGIRLEDIGRAPSSSSWSNRGRFSSREVVVAEEEEEEEEVGGRGGGGYRSWYDIAFEGGDRRSGDRRRDRMRRRRGEGEDRRRRVEEGILGGEELLRGMGRMRVENGRNGMWRVREADEGNSRGMAELPDRGVPQAQEWGWGEMVSSGREGERWPEVGSRVGDTPQGPFGERQTRQLSSDGRSWEGSRVLERGVVGREDEATWTVLPQSSSRNIEIHNEENEDVSRHYSQASPPIIPSTSISFPRRVPDDGDSFRRADGAEVGHVENADDLESENEDDESSNDGFGAYWRPVEETETSSEKEEEEEEEEEEENRRTHITPASDRTDHSAPEVSPVEQNTANEGNVRTVDNPSVDPLTAQTLSPSPISTTR
ncbi:MAG: hypothetical protein M1835_000692, partial [Candelina submexicana]